MLDYLALRTTLPPTGAGASLGELFGMAQYNIGEILGQDWGETAKLALGDPSRFAAQPCCTDNRMHACEWLHGPEGWIKLDGLDHHAAHDLIGCQDIAWDLAGAAVELDLPVNDLGPVLYALLGRDDDPSFIAAMQLCYLGFQIGLWTMAADRNGQDEQSCIQRQIDRYTRRVRALLT
ncbi:hypothetical protein [Devosia aurantiaca]|uniref:Aminoglycoside phosphotransferase domain-containing protein n=1 Tax=Devosia aurantiaca TaxID=2714858 RepID=A0A6M1SW58_9HYPH|nr:hypothetical protein [Devosia aurantiaca]NGP18613.1 hypothetical protein [Devosia aurantiaca]